MAKPCDNVSRVVFARDALPSFVFELSERIHD
jgi:hypothetical protein